MYKVHANNKQQEGSMYFFKNVLNNHTCALITQTLWYQTLVPAKYSHPKVIYQFYLSSFVGKPNLDVDLVMIDRSFEVWRRCKWDSSLNHTYWGKSYNAGTEVLFMKLSQTVRCFHWKFALDNAFIPRVTATWANSMCIHWWYTWACAYSNEEQDR